ncbi:hypothetical protein SAMN04487969_112156 [Paenibacillus algorifonticola]|uniref:Lipoprotein n=1 Tax=Paenibacillus algorifonticola TaxID=684063 RepID=A0A1I2FKX5_9BACL|nr:hypothetical protein [Paenibacillus algorifonticola]SFF05945.1 hypothetical protein SAMN04487969_112156 [Paenibacillus algorifonticola]
MRNVKLLLLLASFSLFLFACSNGSPVDNAGKEVSKEDTVVTVVTHGNYQEFDKENRLFDDAELVVIAETDTNFFDREHVVKYAEQDAAGADLPQALEDFYTRTPIKILKVLKKPESASVIENEEMNIIEPISLIKEDTKSKILSIENYNEINEGEQYVLYLKQNAYGEYSVINMNNGRFSLDSDALKIQSLDHGHENDQDKHNEIKQAVEERFKAEIEEVKNM